MNDGTLTVTQCTFSSNGAIVGTGGSFGKGGAIYIASGSASLYGVTFTLNSCSGYTSSGGAIHLEDGTLLLDAYNDGTTIFGNTFSKNSAYVVTSHRTQKLPCAAKLSN